MSEHNPEAGTPEVPQTTSPDEAIALQADGNPPPLEDQASATDPATAPQPIQAPSPAPQATGPKLLIPGQQPAPAQSAPAPVPQVPQVPPAQPAPAPFAAPVTEAPAPQPAAGPEAAAPPQPTPTPAANPLVIPAAPAVQAAPAPVPQAAPIQPPAPAPVQQAAPTPAPQVTVPLSGSPAIPAAPVQQAAPPANPLLGAAPAPQAAAPPAFSLGVPPQPAAPLGAPKPGGLGIGSVVPLQKKGMSGAVKGMIITTLVAALIVTGIILKGNSDKNDKIERLNAIMALLEDPTVQEIPLSESDVQLLLDEMTTAGTKRDGERTLYDRALRIGNATDGSDFNAKIAGYAKDVDMEDALRSKLFGIVGHRGDESALPALIEFAKNTDSPGTGVAAINAAKKMATASNFKSLLAIVTSSEENSIRASAADVLSKVVAESEDPGAYAQAIVGIYNTSSDDNVKASLLKLMGSAGGDEAADIITENLDGDNDTLKLAAIIALRNWPDDTQFDTLKDFTIEVENDRLRKEAFSGLVRFLKDGPKIDEDDQSLHWYDVASIATEEFEQRSLISAVGSQSGDWADDVLDYFVEFGDNDKVQAAAENEKINFADRKKRTDRGESSKRRKKAEKKAEEEEEEEEEEKDKNDE